jgi:hypothetical protein
MREICKSGSEGGVVQTNALSLPLSFGEPYEVGVFHVGIVPTIAQTLPTIAQTQDLHSDSRFPLADRRSPFHLRPQCGPVWQ